MYITLPGITSGEAVQLTHAIDNTSGQLEVALCDITYLPQWTNINVSNNKLFVGGTRSQITDGYYSVCSLNDEVFKPLGAELKMNDSNGTVVLINNGRNTLRLGRPLARTLGMSPDEIKPTTTVTGTKLPDLVPYRELFIHLGQVSTTYNIQGGHPSTILRAVPVKTEKYNDGRTESFSPRQYKRLTQGNIPELIISVLDINHNPVNIGYLSLTLHIK